MIALLPAGSAGSDREAQACFGAEGVDQLAAAFLKFIAPGSKHLCGKVAPQQTDGPRNQEGSHEHDVWSCDRIGGTR